MWVKRKGINSFFTNLEKNIIRHYNQVIDRKKYLWIDYI